MERDSNAVWMYWRGVYDISQVPIHFNFYEYWKFKWSIDIWWNKLLGIY